MKTIETEVRGIKYRIECPEDMITFGQKILDNEYGLDRIEQPEDAIIIGDLGANVGVFALWARALFPKSVIISYEPNPEAVEILRRNIEENKVDNCFVVPKAVFTSDSDYMLLYQCGDNFGSYSLLPNGEAEHSVTAMSVDRLPAFDFLKMDIEGVEVEVLSKYLEGHRPILITLEYHSDEARRAIDALLSDYRLVYSQSNFPGLGTVCYVRHP
jgi:FkbM family methyltransferase